MTLQSLLPLQLLLIQFPGEGAKTHLPCSAVRRPPCPPGQGGPCRRRPTRVPLEILPMEGKLARTSREKVLEKCCTLSWNLDSLKTALLSKSPEGHPPHHPVWLLTPEDCFLLSARACFPEQPQGGHASPLGPGLLLSSLSFHPPPGVG